MLHFLIIVITEAGKLALNLTKGSQVKRLQVASRGTKGTGRKIITIRRDQIQSSKILSPNSSIAITSRGPNILRRSPVDKTAKLFVTTIPNTSTISTVTEMKNSLSSKEVKLYIHIF